MLPYDTRIARMNGKPVHQFIHVYFYISSGKTMTSITTKLLQNSTILTTTKIQQHQSTTPDEGISNLVFQTTLIEGESTGEGKATYFNFFFNRLIFSFITF